MMFQVDNVLLVDRLGAEASIPGTIHVTTSHIIYRAEDGSKEFWVRIDVLYVLKHGK